MLELVASDVAQHGAHSSIPSSLGLVERKYRAERFAHAAFDGIVERQLVELQAALPHGLGHLWLATERLGELARQVGLPSAPLR